MTRRYLASSDGTGLRIDGPVPNVTPEQVRRVRLLAANVADRDGWIYAEHAPLAEVLGMLGVRSP